MAVTYLASDFYEGKIRNIEWRHIQAFETMLTEIELKQSQQINYSLMRRPQWVDVVAANHFQLILKQIIKSFEIQILPVNYCRLLQFVNVF